MVEAPVFCLSSATSPPPLAVGFLTTVYIRENFSPVRPSSSRLRSSVTCERREGKGGAIIIFPGIEVRQEKTDELLWIPCHSKLRDALDRAERKSEFILTTQRGSGYSDGAFCNESLRKPNSFAKFEFQFLKDPDAAFQSVVNAAPGRPLAHARSAQRVRRRFGRARDFRQDSARDPADHFAPEDIVLLAEYCRTAAMARRASDELAVSAVAGSMPSPWLAVHASAVRSLATLSTRPRLGPRSRSHNVRKAKLVSAPSFYDLNPAPASSNKERPPSW